MTKQIQQFTGYFITPDGTITNRNGKVIKARPNCKSGYLMSVLWQNSKAINVYVHRLVAEAFLPNPEGCKYVQFIDGDKTNVAVENLRWSNTINRVANNFKEFWLNYGTEDK